MPHFRIALLPGDGIGPEVILSARKVLDAALETLDGIQLEYTEFSVGAGEYLKNGDPLPPATMAAIQKYDAVLLGAIGLPSVRWPSGLEMTPQIDIREQLDLYQGLRPIRLFHPSHSPLRPEIADGIDLMLVRENTEGLFSSRKDIPQFEDNETKTDLLKISRKGSERIIRAAFDLARKRRRHLTLVDKANVLPSMAFFRQIFDRISKEYSDVETNRVYIDAMALYLVQAPRQFDVIVTENMFGDILSDLTAGLVGGMGMAPSADIGDRHAVFQPSHGSAPAIAGKGIANPIATILSAAMMLEWLGLEETRKAGRIIEMAISKILSEPDNRTIDLGGQLKTDEITNMVIEEIQSPKVKVHA